MAIQHENTVLSTRELSVGYVQKNGVHKVLQGINLQLEAGQLVCFMGPNGVGKSTLLRTLVGMQKPLSGEVWIGKDVLHSLSIAKLAEKVSTVLTDKLNALNMNGRELIALGRYPYLPWHVRMTAEDHEKIEAAIEATQCGGFAHKKVYALSDGQLQKVMIARALCQDTPLMILDEPTAHLDLNNRVEIMTVLSELAHTTGKSIIMATHELDLALQMADKLWLAGFDQPIAEGVPEDMVLNGAIDTVFQFKGYDLKTGRVQQPSTGKTVALEGEGHAFLWTKNALERNGYVVERVSALKIYVIDDGEAYTWEVQGAEKGEFNTIEALLAGLPS